MLILCIVPDQKTSVQNYAVANVKAYFLYRRFTKKLNLILHILE